LCREAERERDLAERTEFEQRLRAKDAEERQKRHGGKHIEEEHAALDVGMDDAGKKSLLKDLRQLSEQAYLEKRQEKKLQARVFVFAMASRRWAQPRPCAWRPGNCMRLRLLDVHALLQARAAACAAVPQRRLLHRAGA
jgi:hypothetical protein